MDQTFSGKLFLVVIIIIIIIVGELEHSISIETKKGLRAQEHCSLFQTGIFSTCSMIFSMRKVRILKPFVQYEHKRISPCSFWMFLN